jgi:uncharacterized protein
LALQIDVKARAINNVFVIPLAEQNYIIYLPIQGILLKANATAVNLFQKALDGDEEAQLKFGLDRQLVERLNKSLDSPFSEALKKEIFQPVMVSLFLTTDCSMRCGYCYASGGDQRMHMKKEYIEVAINEIIQNALKKKAKRIVVNYHGGGDIATAWGLLKETTACIKEKASANNLAVTFSAGLNGVLSDYQRKWIVDNIHSVTLSLDGDEEIQNELRPLKNGLPSFGIVDRTIKYFDTRKYNYAIRITVTSATVNKLERIISFICENYGVKHIKAEPVYMHGRANKSDITMPGEDTFISNFLKARKIALRHGKELLYSGARFDVFTTSFCKATGASFGVTPDGYISSCYEVLDKNNAASDIFFYGQIVKGKIIIEQDKLDNLTHFTVMNKEKCANCFAKFHCAGDCPVKSVLSTTENEMYNYRCKINRAITKQQLLEAIEETE